MPFKSKVDLKKAESERLLGFLHELLREEENKYCADCEAKQPRWASWNLGVFLCIRCAGLHRNLGVHISKVKSINLDSWTAEQVQHMRVMGNAKAKAVYEAELPQMFRRPQSDQTLESFIRAKYEAKRYILKDWVLPIVNVADLPLQKTTNKNIEITNCEKKLLQSKKSVIDQNFNKEKKISNCNTNLQPILIDFNETCDTSNQTNNNNLTSILLSEYNQNDLDDLFGPIVSAPITKSLQTSALQKSNTIEKVYQLTSILFDEKLNEKEKDLNEINFNLKDQNLNQDVKKSTSDILALYNCQPNTSPNFQCNTTTVLNTLLNTSKNFQFKNAGFQEMPVNNNFLNNTLYNLNTKTQNCSNLSNNMENLFNSSNILLTNTTNNNNSQSEKSEITTSALNDLFGQFKL